MTVALACLPTFVAADIELTVEQAQAFEDGGCFYVVATPTNGETINNYVFNFSTTSMDNLSIDWANSGLTRQAQDLTGIFGGWTHVRADDGNLPDVPFGIQQQFVVAQFTYETSSPGSVSFQTNSQTSFDTSAGNLSSAGTSPNRLVLPAFADGTGVFSHASTMFSGNCAAFVPVPEPSSFMFLSLILLSLIHI